MMRGRRPKLAFVSPVFLFPNDAGGKIRTTNILRGMKGGIFDITLLSPASSAQASRYASELEGVCDEFVAWQPRPARHRWMRSLDLLDELPVNVVADRTAVGADLVLQTAKRGDIDLMVFDFVHSAVLLPDELAPATVCFTHNVEAEIFARHAKVAGDAVKRKVWDSQHRKMARFERRVLARFDKVIAVSERDALHFTQNYGLQGVESIPTGVDLDYFAWQLPAPVGGGTTPTVLFTGSMDWVANVDGVAWFLRNVWPRVRAENAGARFLVVGRNPPPSLVAMGGAGTAVEFTGFVDDVRPYAREAHAFVIPLLVGGGTRIKAFEAMALGVPVVGTSVGMEGLGATADSHYLQQDDAAGMAQAVLALLGDHALRQRLSLAARELVEQRYGHRVAAKAFEAICERAVNRVPEPASV